MDPLEFKLLQMVDLQENRPQNTFLCTACISCTFKAVLIIFEPSKEKGRKKSECYSQEEEVLYYITPKYKQVLPSTLAPTDNSKLQP